MSRLVKSIKLVLIFSPVLLVILIGYPLIPEKEQLKNHPLMSNRCFAFGDEIEFFRCMAREGRKIRGADLYTDTGRNINYVFPYGRELFVIFLGILAVLIWILLL